MLFKFKKIVGCIEPWVKNRDANRIVSLCIVTALMLMYEYIFLDSIPTSVGLLPPPPIELT